MFIHRAMRSLACTLSLAVAIGLTGAGAAHAAADPGDEDPSTTAGRWHTADERAQSRTEQSTPAPPNRLFSAAAAPANDLLANATKVTSLPFDVSRQPFGGATLEADEPATCRTTDPDSTEYFTDGERSTWYSYTSPVAQTLSFGGGVDGRESMVIAYAAAAMSSLTRISCTETGFRDENHLQAKAGTTYLFQVTDDAYNAASADTASLWIRASAPLSNLSPATASSVSVPSTVTGSIAKVDNNWYEPYAGTCGDGFATLLATRWYKYVATGTTGVRVDLRDSYYEADAVVWASDGSVPTSVLTCPAQQRGDGGATGFYERTNAYADFAVEPGKTYFIQIGGWNFSVGDYVMKLSTYQLPLLTQMPTPKITGTAQVGSTLTVNPGTWDEGTTLTYQWMRGNGSYISGAKGTTYTVGAANVGTQITVAVSATKPGYSPARKTSAPTAVVAKGTLSGATPTITGTTKVGYTLTARAGTWAPAPVALSYQWARNGVAISGATSSTYKLTSSDKGKRITVKVTGTKTGYTTLAKTSAATATIG